jgi:hypothetical protein
MKKLTIESLKVIVDKENLNAVLFENRTEKYVLYAKTQIDAPNDPAFKPFSFTEAINITPKKKLASLNFRLDHKNSLNILYYKNYPVYFVSNNNLNVKNNAYKLILLSGELFVPKTVFPVDTPNIIVPTAASLVASLSSSVSSSVSSPVVSSPVAVALSAAPSVSSPVAVAPSASPNASSSVSSPVAVEPSASPSVSSSASSSASSPVAVAPITSSSASSPVAVAPNASPSASPSASSPVLPALVISSSVSTTPVAETIEEESDSEYEEEDDDTEEVDDSTNSIKIEEKKEFIKVDDNTKSIQINDKKEVIKVEEKKESIKVIPLVEVEKKEIIEPPVPKIKVINIDSEIPEKLAVNKIDEIKQQNIKADIEEILHNFNHLFKDIKNEKTDIEKKQLIENKLKEIDLIKENQLKNEDIKHDVMQDGKHDGKHDVKKEVVNEVLKNDMKKEVVNEVLNNNMKQEEKKIVVKELNEDSPEYIKINYQNIIYNLPSYQLLSSKDLNATNLFQTIIPERNYIKQNITYQLENVNSSYLLVFRKQKYLVNKINNTLVIINLVNKSSVIAKNNSNFKLDNYDYVLYNNGTLMIPVINKRIYDNSYGMAYNMYLPVF